jgi:hypothetical protein
MRNEVRPASSCQVNEIIPWSHLTIHDQHFNAKNGFPPRQVYVEGVDNLPGLAGESRDFDANGPYIRILLTGGTYRYSLTPPGAPNKLYGQALAPIFGTQPTMPVSHVSGDGAKVKVTRPPLKPNVPCETQPAITENGLQAPASGAPPTVPTGPTTAGSSERERSAALMELANLVQQSRQDGIPVPLKTVPNFR